jgi:hypothetical protein
MPDPIITILIFIAVIAITALLFGGWLIVMTFTAITRLLLLPFRAGRRGQMPATSTAMLDGEVASPRCPNERCRAENPPVAAFCRRCGSPLRAAAVQQVPVRRVAMW